MLPLCLVVAFLLPATQINPATNRKITAQNYCPPCQLGKLPSSRISTDILAPVPKTSSNSVPPRIKSQPGTLLLAHSKPTVHKIQQCTENRCSQQNTTVQRLSAHGKTQPSRGSLLTVEYNSSYQYTTVRLSNYSPQHPFPPRRMVRTSPSSRPLFLPADSCIYFTTTPVLRPSSLH
jgi:hypothetical protein